MVLTIRKILNFAGYLLAGIGRSEHYARSRYL